VHLPEEAEVEFRRERPQKAQGTHKAFCFSCSLCLFVAYFNVSVCGNVFCASSIPALSNSSLTRRRHSRKTSACLSGGVLTIDRIVTPESSSFSTPNTTGCSNMRSGQSCARRAPIL